MRAVTYSRYGPPEVLDLEEVPKPLPAADEVLVRVRAAEVTKSDCEMRGFRFAVNWFWLPLRIGFGLFRPRRRILGGYFAGEIAAVGANVTGFAPGEAVFGAAGLRFGAYAEYLVLPAQATLVAMPANMRFEEAAAVPLGGLNALHFMRLAQIQAGDKVLVIGAGASIGAHAVQIARSLGAEVTAVDAPHKADFLRRLGARHFVDYTTQDFTRGGRSYDVILSVVAGSPYGACLRLLTPGGRYLLANPRLSDMLRSVITGWFTDKTVRFAFARETREELRELKEMVERGSVVPIVDRVYPMEQAADGHRYVEAERRLGAVVMKTVSQDDA